MITEDYVSFETAKLLKEKGFSSDEISCIKVFKGHTYKVQGTTIDADEDVTIPTIQLSMKWLRETHNLFVFPFPQMNANKFWVEIYQLSDNKEWENLYCESIDLKDYLLYEQACEAGIKYCLENLI